MSSDIGLDVFVTAVLLVEALVMRRLALVLVVVGLAFGLVM
jgi:hypothetical protein